MNAQERLLVALDGGEPDRVPQALWGTVGRQWTFQWATPDQIRQEVQHRVETLGRAGLVLCPAYDLDSSATSRRNVAAFLEAAAAYG